MFFYGWQFLKYFKYKRNIQDQKNPYLKHCKQSTLHLRLSSNHTQNKSKKNKQLQINATPYIFVILYCLLFFIFISLFLSSSTFCFLFLPFCLHPHKELNLIFIRILISLEFGCQHCIKDFLKALLMCSRAVLSETSFKYLLKVYIISSSVCFYFRFMFSKLHTTCFLKKVLVFVGFLAVSNSPMAASLQTRNILLSHKFR